MVVNFVGNYQSGYVGEQADEVHLAREIENLGNIVRRIPRDEWREYVLEGFPKDKYKGVPEDLKADINIVAKWHHFYDGSFVTALKQLSEAPVFYWVWDYMFDDSGQLEEWHLRMAQAANLYLSGEGGKHDVYKALDVKHYYFQFDVCDGELETRWRADNVEHDVIFTGSYLPQGNRIEWLKIINQVHPVTIYSWNHEEWQKEGFEAYPAVYGEEYNDLISKSKIVLGFSVYPTCWGYWSNRVGKVIRAGGFLLQEYAPGMELFLDDLVEYFSSPEEAIEKISFYLKDNSARGHVTGRVKDFNWKFTSKEKVKQLMILVERYIKDPRRELWQI